MATGELNQPVLDRLASSWSRLDRARPREQTGVPDAICALGDWVASALLVDAGLAATLGGAYLAARPEEPGGPAIGGLRHVEWLMDRGAMLGDIVVPTTGTPHEFWELAWRPLDELPVADGAAGAACAYREHLAGRDVRRPAAATTTFLLSIAVALRSEAWAGKLRPG